MNIFEKQIRLNVSKKNAFEFHEQKGALKRLTPPWQKIKTIFESGHIKPGANAKLYIYDPVKIIWKARHLEYEKNNFFSDIQESGPFKYWKHNHFFEEISRESCIMRDKIEFSLPFEKISFPLNNFIEKKLFNTFLYRHKILKRDLEINSKYKVKKNILISGASGVLGNILIPRLTTAGHNVRTLVRFYPKNKNQFYWNPEKKIIDEKAFKNVDAVINLSGEPIGTGWWTKGKKARIIKSRVDTAGLLSETISKSDSPPELFISSSATGYYGNTGDKDLNEKSGKGNLFISHVCHKWEKAALSHLNPKTRTVILRTGVVLTPLGGALPIILRGFYTGTGGIPGNGRQFVSWISSEDWLNIVYEILFNENISGVVNASSPDPVSFRELISSVSKVLNLPAYFKIPKSAVKLFTGARGYETVICGAKAFPEKLINNNFKFFHNYPAQGLKEMLGRENNDI